MSYEQWSCPSRSLKQSAAFSVPAQSCFLQGLAVSHEQRTCGKVQLCKLLDAIGYTRLKLGLESGTSQDTQIADRNFHLRILET